MAAGQLVTDQLAGWWGCPVSGPTECGTNLVGHPQVEGCVAVVPLELDGSAPLELGQPVW
jgi:hypothetical protein